MTDFATATLYNLLLRRFAPPTDPRNPRLSTPRARPVPCNENRPPILFRSEGFAEDLCDSHPVKP